MSPRDRIAAMIERAGRRALHVLGPPEATELERFIAQWPNVAARLGLEVEPQPVLPVGVGTVWYPRASDGIGFSPDTWRDWIRRHVATGELGDDGLVRSEWALEAEQQELWPLPLLTDIPQTFGPRPMRVVRAATVPAIATLFEIAALPLHAPVTPIDRPTIFYAH